MPPIAIPDTFQVVCSGQNLGTEWANVWGLKSDGPTLVDQSVADGIGAAFLDFYFQFTNLLNFGWSLDEVVVRDLRTTSSPSWDATIAGTNGTQAANAMPPQSSIVLSHGTGFRGKSYRGRTYLGGFTEVSNDGDGTIIAATRTQLLTNLDGLKTDLLTRPGGPWRLAVVSRTLLVSNVITSTTIDPEWDRQDRRKRD